MKKRILACSFFPAFNPPMSGGEQKLLRFYEALSQYFEIDLVSFTYPTRSETLLHAPDFREHRIARDRAWEVMAGQLAKDGFRGELSALLTALQGRIDSSAYRDKLASLWDHADIIMHDFPYTLTLEPFGQDPTKLRVYNSHNFEATLTRSVFSCPEAGPDLHDLVERLEEELAARADLVFATTPLEAEAMALRYGLSPSRVEILPLGFDPREVAPPESDENPFVLFIGSGHSPNIAAAQEVAALAHMLPQIDFVIAGSVCQHLSNTAENLRLLGQINPETRRNLFARAALFLNPMQAGAGMNVKLAEALGAGLSVVSSPLGARGFDVEALGITLAQDRQEMAEAIVAKLSRPQALRACERQEIAREARDRHGWDRLAAKAAAALTRALGRPEPAPLPQIQLFVNDYPLGEGLAGGQRRMLSLLKALPTPDLKVFLSLHDESDIRLRQRSANVIEINLPKTAAHRNFDRLCATGSTLGIGDFAAAMHVAENPLFLRWFKALVARSASLTFEHCYMAPLLDHLPKGAKPRLIYSAHNVEADLKRDLLREACHSHGPQLIALAQELEEGLYRRADAVIAVSPEDEARFKSLYGPHERLEVVANGTSISECPLQKPIADCALRLVFIGSGHMPNVVGLRTFLRDVWPLLAGAHLDVIGNVCSALSAGEGGPQVTLWGMVGEEIKTRLLAQADLAINPALQGGGSSLKIGDYLAAGLPIVSTPQGLRGFEPLIGKAVLVRELGQAFADGIEELARDGGLRREMGCSGHAYAKEQLDWRHLGQKSARLLAPAATTPYLQRPASLVVADDLRLGAGLDDEALSGRLAFWAQKGAVDLLFLRQTAPSRNLQLDPHLRHLRHLPLQKGGDEWLLSQAPRYDRIALLQDNAEAAALLRAAGMDFVLL